MKSLKTFNDPIYGFITIDDELIFQLLEHPSFQRLRRISQLGLTNLVYSGANHSRFQHALGAMNLMKSAIQVLRSKNVEISLEDEQAAKIAILLHDIGHGPFSHALESTIVKGTHHERIGLLLMNKLNEEMEGRLSRAIAIYKGEHHVKFLHQLVSSQLDVDRLDYLKRDSFFTGVSEGIIGSERLIKMMNVNEDQLVVEAKGIYSLEKFLLARRLMYWQVYLHKTVVSAEFLLMHILKRAQDIDDIKTSINGNPLGYFLLHTDDLNEVEPKEWLDMFLDMDDFDVMSAIKRWTKHPDEILSRLCRRLIYRDLLKIKPLEESLPESEIETLRTNFARLNNLSLDGIEYLIFQKSVTNRAYNRNSESITILYKDGHVKNLADAASIFQFGNLDEAETKHYLYYPKGFNVQ